MSVFIAFASSVTGTWPDLQQALDTFVEEIYHAFHFIDEETDSWTS